MKRVLRGFFCLLTACFVVISAWAYNGDTIVYVTKTGRCYHLGGCSYLNSRIEITLQAATDCGYRPCSRCHPPVLDSDAGPISSAEDETRYVITIEDPPAPDPVQEPQQQPPAEEQKDRMISRVLLVPVILFAAIYGGGAILVLPKELLHRREKKEQDERLRAEYLGKYGGKSKQKIASMCGMPSSSMVGEDGLPHGRTGAFDPYLVYVAKSGTCYHRAPRCGGARLYAENIVNVFPYRHACSRCGGPVPDTTWFFQYRQIIREMHRLGIPDPPLVTADDCRQTGIGQK